MSPRPRFASLAPEKSAAILAAAASELAERGIEGASYNRIIERAGVSKGAMYYYFDDKWDLFATVVQNAGERAAAAIGALAHFDDAHSYWDAMLELYERVTRFFVDEPMLAALLKAVLAQPPGSDVSELFAEYMGRVRTYYHAALEQGVRVGAIRDDLPLDLLTHVSFAMGEAMDRWTLDRWSTLTPADFERVSRDMLAMHMRALAPLSILIEWERRGDASPEPEAPE